MYEPARHIAPSSDPWDPVVAQSAIDEIVADALARFDAKSFWPVHPLEDNAADGMANLYFGAAGVIWALDYLHRNGATTTGHDFTPVLDTLLAAIRAQCAGLGDYGRYASLLMSDLGVLMVTMRLAPTTTTADLVYRRIGDNLTLPVLELMWGTSGSMLAALFMAEMTGEERWLAAYRAQAARLVDDLEDSEFGPLWTQQLYGQTRRYLGAVHGFAGNMVALLRGWEELGDAQRERITAAIACTIPASASVTDMGANWPAVAVREASPRLVQHCHGAPGMVTVLADFALWIPEIDQLLRSAGDFIWATGPLAKGSNLCHGTAGNGYALLKLHRRFGEPVWLERARAFAMTAIAQCRADRALHDRGRYSLWTGDPGLAIYLWDCLRTEPRFPTTDVF